MAKGRAWSVVSVGVLISAWGSSFSCAASDAHPVDPNAAPKPGMNVDVAELEISATGVDRFASCPPPGELGQDWIPKLPDWSPGSSRSSSSGSADALDGGSYPLPPDDVTMHGSTPTARAIADTHEAFRSCYHHGLVYDPTQDGRVAIVLRVGADGRVAQVESYGACEIASEAIICMRDSAKKLRFRPPAGGSDTITIPAVFTSSNAVRRTSPSARDAYTAAVYVAVEGLRPPFHECEQSARQEGRPVVATATFALDLDAQGRVTHANIEPWSGDKDLLACAANAFQSLAFPPPPGGAGTVLARLAFNPRAGTK